MRHVLISVMASIVAFPMAASKVVFPWFCLERCGDNSSQISNEIRQVEENASVFSAVAFEDFNLGPNSTLVVNNLTQVAAAIREAGLAPFAMVSSYPYPPQFLDYMRAVFSAPEPFIAACLEAAAMQGLAGFNIDWEPQTGEAPTPADAADYAAFLGKFSSAMHAAGLVVSVDVATWSPIWDVPAIAASGVDLIATMSTYTANWTTWQAELAYFVSVVPAAHLVIGLETVRDSDNEPYTTAELAQRFGALAAAGASQVAIWRSPIPDNWWPFLRAL
jgi:spore germination protein YaaH